MAMRVGLVGWRGMVGSVLMDRMQAEKDFDHIDPVFFSTSNAGGKPPLGHVPLKDAHALADLESMKVIISCQGGEYTSAIVSQLRSRGWDGYWIDAASTLRMHEDAVIILDPLNRHVIDAALDQGIKNYIGGNCTVSLMMMGLNGLFREGLIEWISAMTYQAASGAGAQNMRELLHQMGALHSTVAQELQDPASPILDIDRKVLESMRETTFPTTHFQVPLAGSLIPWIDKDLENGMSKEEWKGDAECNKILGLPLTGPGRIPIESLCIRISAMRCHSQALTISLKEDLPLSEIERIVRSGNPWVHLVPNNRAESIRELTPTFVTGSLKVAIGRLRKMSISPKMLSAFTVGDQLLWGAAEPLRRMLRILLERK